MGNLLILTPEPTLQLSAAIQRVVCEKSPIRVFSQIKELAYQLKEAFA